MSDEATSLPDLSSSYPLSESEVEQFRDRGHVLLRGVCSREEIAAYRPFINEAAYKFNKQTRPVEERDTYGKAFLQITNLWERDERVRRYVMAKRFGKIAADLLGVNGIRIYHDQALYKEAGGGLTPWHQDQQYWPLDAPTVTMWMPLVDVPVETGALTFASGTHREGYLGHMAISDESQETWDKYVQDQRIPVHVEPVMAGDATFHAGWTLHTAPGNAGTQTREVMTIIFIPDGVRIIEPDNPNRWDDLRTWFPGLKPGDFAASELNPLVFDRQAV